MKYINRRGYIQESNKWYGVILGNERRRRGISLEKLSSGILSRTTLDNIEKGKAECTKLAWDTLMLRMGISPDYFESIASGEELDRWRLREDICLLASVSPGEAVAKLAEYRKKYGKKGAHRGTVFAEGGGPPDAGGGYREAQERGGVREHKRWQ